MDSLQDKIQKIEEVKSAPKKRIRKKKIEIDCLSETPCLDSSQEKSGFSEFLKRINSARISADETIEKCARDGRRAEVAIAMAWEFLFDFFCRTPPENLELGELNTLAGVVQKLASSENSARGISLKTNATTKLEAGLSEEALREIENMLKLL